VVTVGQQLEWSLAIGVVPVAGRVRRRFDIEIAWVS